MCPPLQPSDPNAISIIHTMPAAHRTLLPLIILSVGHTHSPMLCTCDNARRCDTKPRSAVSCLGSIPLAEHHTASSTATVLGGSSLNVLLSHHFSTCHFHCSATAPFDPCCEDSTLPLFYRISQLHEPNAVDH